MEKALKGFVVNRELPSLHERLHEITLTVPLRLKLFNSVKVLIQIFEILLKFYETADWKLALVAGVPPRTGFIIKQ